VGYFVKYQYSGSGWYCDMAAKLAGVPERPFLKAKIRSGSGWNSPGW
jgi:hypothetical protein